jgi:hypothetical protein
MTPLYLVGWIDENTKAYKFLCRDAPETENPQEATSYGEQRAREVAQLFGYKVIEVTVHYSYDYRII